MKSDYFINYEYEVAKEADIEGLINLRRLLLSGGNSHYSSSSPEEDEAWQLHYRNWLIQKLGNGTSDSRIVVIRDEDSHVIACATGIIDERAPMIGALNGLQGWIQSVVVAPQWRGKGLATLLMEALFSWFSAKQVGKVVLQTTPAADSVYKKLGFEDSGEDLLIKKL